MAINYSAGLNPMFDRFSQQVSQSSNQILRAGQLAQARENDRYNKLAELGGSIGKAVKDARNKEVKDFAESTEKTESYLTKLRDSYDVGSQSWQDLNKQVLSLDDTRDKQIQAYRDSGFFNKDESLLDLDKGRKKPNYLFSGKDDLNTSYDPKVERQLKDQLVVNKTKLKELESKQKKQEDMPWWDKKTSMKPDFIGDGSYDRGMYESDLSSQIAKRKEEISSIEKDLGGMRKIVEKGGKRFMQGGGETREIIEDENEGFVDPATGLFLRAKDLKKNEQRLYQEGKEKISRSAQTKLKLGMDLNEDERAYYGDFDDVEFAELQQEAQEPEFRQKITDAITFGKKFDLKDPNTQKIAESMNISGKELNDFIDDQYEEKLYKDIQRSGDDFEALGKIAKKAEGRNLPTLTDSRMNNLIEEAKQSQRDTIYGGLGTVLRSSDPAGALQAFEQRYGKKAQYLIDSKVINQGDYNKLLGSVRSRASKSATEADVKTKKSLFGLLDKNLEAYATLAQSGKPVSNALQEEIRTLAQQLDLDGNELMADGATQESYKRQRANIGDIAQKLSVENAVSKKLYNDVFGSGATVDFKGFREDGSPNFDLKEKQGQLDPVKLRNAFINQYTRANFGTAPTTGQVDAFVEEMINYNKVIRLGLTPSIRESRIQDSLENN